MNNYQLIYSSKATGPLTWKMVKEIAGNAAAKNKLLNITGLLVFGDGHFVQILEGSQEEINKLYLKISQDSRHNDIRLLNYSKIVRPHFEHWNMGCLLIDNQPVIKDIIKKYFKSEEFEPHLLSPEQAFLFITEIGFHFEKP